MLDPVKDVLRNFGFATTNEVFKLIQDTREYYSEANAGSPRLEADLAETSWLFTYPTIVDEKSLTRVVYFHQSVSREKFAVVSEGRVICFPSGFTLEQAQEIQNRLQEVVTNALTSLPYDQAKGKVIIAMVRLMHEVSQTSNSVSPACDVAIISGKEVFIASGVGVESECFTFSTMLG